MVTATGCSWAGPRDVVANLTIRSDVAAPKWDHGYPVGNGRLGLLTLGDHPKEGFYLKTESVVN